MSFQPNQPHLHPSLHAPSRAAHRRQSSSASSTFPVFSGTVRSISSSTVEIRDCYVISQLSDSIQSTAQIRHLKALDPRLFPARYSTRPDPSSRLSFTPPSRVFVTRPDRFCSEIRPVSQPVPRGFQQASDVSFLGQLQPAMCHNLS
ncbi:hypothetical protein PIB30_019298 [Stylosanthes scabra]|uniref:Uncharacterized protein n=1 Tax=Stylosanthes scabra TaxID=79078 RepID=A0ABU6V6A4_9FABA|nr:hypothetical protein [Stylosanthes scabra]